MTPELITTWTDHDNGLQKILLLARGSLRIFDEDLVRLGLEKAENAFFLRRFLAANRTSTLNIVLRNAEPLRRNSPRLMKLLTDYPNAMQVSECAPQLAELKDSMVLADDSHALIRFHQDHARSKLIVDNIDECRPYHLRFEEILREGGHPVSATTLGL